MFQFWAPALIAIVCSLAAGYILGTPHPFWSEKNESRIWVCGALIVLAFGFCANFVQVVNNRMLVKHWDCIAADRRVCPDYTVYDSIAVGVLLLIVVIICFLLAWGYSWVMAKILFCH